MQYCIYMCTQYIYIYIYIHFYIYIYIYICIVFCICTQFLVVLYCMLLIACCTGAQGGWGWERLGGDISKQQTKPNQYYTKPNKYLLEPNNTRKISKRIDGTHTYQTPLTSSDIPKNRDHHSHNKYICYLHMCIYIYIYAY